MDIKNLSEEQISELLDKIRNKKLLECSKVDSSITKANLFKPEFSMVVLGNSRAGKTTFITNLILNEAYKIQQYYKPQNIILISPNAFTDKTWVDFQKQLYDPKKLPHDFNINDNVIDDESTYSQVLVDLIKQQKELIKSDPQLCENKLIIIDDVVNTAMKLNNGSLISMLYTQGRHLNISPVLLTQSHKTLGNTIRRNCNYWILFQLNIYTEIQSVSQEMRLPKMKATQFEDIYLKALSDEPYSFLLINMRAPIAQRMCINLNKVLQLDY